MTVRENCCCSALIVISNTKIPLTQINAASSTFITSNALYARASRRLPANLGLENQYSRTDLVALLIAAAFLPTTACSPSPRLVLPPKSGIPTHSPCSLCVSVCLCVCSLCVCFLCVCVSLFVCLCVCFSVQLLGSVMHRRWLWLSASQCLGVNSARISCCFFVSYFSFLGLMIAGAAALLSVDTACEYATGKHETAHVVFVSFVDPWIASYCRSKSSVHRDRLFLLLLGRRKKPETWSC